MNKKCSCFEYLIDCLYRRNNGVLNDFTTLKLIKLLFLVVGVSSTEQERGVSPKTQLQAYSLKHTIS